MGVIKILDESVSNIIAAGEVVESSASLIKELLENSLDAESTYVKIEVKNGGRDLKIFDNGKGMSQDDLLLCTERHATSKIFTKEDLFSLSTYGFRGEALSSIAAVSKMVISSKREEDNIGSQINVSGGKITGLKEISKSRGTEIEIKELFFNTPARLKFLKKPSTEYGNIKDIVLKEALANPNISIILIIEGKEVLRTSGHGIENCLLEVFGKNIVKNLKAFPMGFLGAPSINRSTKDSIYTFVNGRAVTSKVLESALLEGYHTKLMKGKYPFAIIFYNADPKEIDVNVHPSKKIIKFSDEELVYHELLNEIENSFKNDSCIITPEINLPKQTFEIEENFNFLSIEEFEQKPIRNTVIPKVEKKEPQKEFKTFFENPLTESKESYKLNIESKDFRIIGQFLNSFILVEHNKVLEIYDQHVVHERILYEELLREHTARTIHSQQLLVPIKIDLLPRERELIFENYTLFQELGFEIDEFGNSEILIRAIPAFDFRESIETMIKD
jgi:DNA mismatch repair protein MutL